MKYWKKTNVRTKGKASNQKVEMGGGSDWPQHHDFCPNGLTVEDTSFITRPLDPRRGAKAEDRTTELITRIQPNRLSEMHRNAVASYVQRLISKCVPCQVFTFGSVPLKTYLPDGDIDLTAFSEDQNLKDTWAMDVQHALQKEEENEHAEFPVKEVQLIHAEVKIIKCLVDNIVVDISFNQLGGLCTLCFLEEVDNLISQNHLFKRSIILVKAWCYYESRILGAHHGLISTYALETLVLYIFHVFNNSFAGPLEVLYRFLEFFSKFDWENLCLSLWGPVPISTLPNMKADPPRKDGRDLLLSQMFLDSCGTAYSVFPAVPETREIPFTSKHFNVVDPLRLNNNLGRSVSRGNFYRIRSAFSLGAQQLAEIFKCPMEDIVPKLDQFFMNTWDRHGKGCRPDAPIFDSSIVDVSVQFNTTSPYKDLTTYKQKANDESRSHVASERSKLWKKQHDDIKRTCMMNIIQNNGHTTHHFARTSSSPELTSMSSEAANTFKRNVTAVKVGNDTSSRPEISRRRENHVANRFNDEPSIREGSSRHSPASSLDRASMHESRHRCAEEQDSMNKLSSSGIQHYGGHSQMPLNLASHSFVPFPPSIMRYGHPPSNDAATNPTNLLGMVSDWDTVMNYSNGHSSAPFHQHLRPVKVISEHGKMVRGLSERVASPEVDNVDEHSGFWNDHPNTEFDPEGEDFSTASSRLLPASPSTSCRTKASSESSWDGKPDKLTNTSRYPVGKTSSSIRKSGVTVNTRWEEDGDPVDHSCDEVDEGQKDWAHLSGPESVSRSSTTSLMEGNQIPGFGQPQIMCQNSMSPFGSFLPHPGSHNGVVYNPSVVPVAFYPAGPHVPFVTMVPVYNMPNGHNSLEKGKPPYPVNHPGCSSNPGYKQEPLSQSNYDSRNIIAFGEHSVVCGPDIFSSDFTNHWKNLQYGRFCQGSLPRHPSVNPPSVLVPSVPSQGTSSVVSSVRPDTFAHTGPVSAPQPGSGKPVGVSRRYGGQVSKQRNGTGTYIPNPHIIKVRQYSTTRQYAEDYGHDRNENHEDRETNRNFNSKPRYNGRAPARNYYEKQNTKITRCILFKVTEFLQREMLFIVLLCYIFTVVPVIMVLGLNTVCSLSLFNLQRDWETPSARVVWIEEIPMKYKIIQNLQDILHQIIHLPKASESEHRTSGGLNINSGG